MTPTLSAYLAIALGVVTFAARAVTLSGALTGAGLVYVLSVLGGLPLVVALALLVVVGHGVSRLGRDRKVRSGVAQEHDGRRTFANALANVGPSVLFVVFGGVDGGLAAIAALAVSLADTVGSEIGALATTPPRRLLFGERVLVGANGGMTWLGTGAGALAALLMGGVAWWSSGPLGAGLVTVAGVAGSWLDSWLGATVEARLPRAYANHLVNGLASTCGGGVVLAVLAGPFGW